MLPGGFRKSREYIKETQIRPWVINQYTSLKNQGFTEEDLSVLKRYRTKSLAVLVPLYKEEKQY